MTQGTNDSAVVLQELQGDSSASSGHEASHSAHVYTRFTADTLSTDMSTKQPITLPAVNWQANCTNILLTQQL